MRTSTLTARILAAAWLAIGCGEASSPPGASGAGAGGAGGAGGSPSSHAGGGGAGRGGAGGTMAAGGTGGGGAAGTNAGDAGGAGTGGAGTGGTAGAPSTGGSSGSDASAERPPDDAAPGGGQAGRFSFFYTSLAAMRRLSGNPNGFGGDLRFGAPTGLEGADKICQTIAAEAGAGGKTWRAFLSVVRGPGGQPVHAIDRIGEGPWYDRTGRLIAMNKAGLLAGDRPMGDGPAVNDLPDEKGTGTRALGDTHDVITASDRMGRLRTPSLASTCQDWTSATGGSGVGAGHSWPAGSGRHWIQAHSVPGCAPGVNTSFTPMNQGIGGYGGWGGFYCFALTP